MRTKYLHNKWTVPFWNLKPGVPQYLKILYLQLFYKQEKHDSKIKYLFLEVITVLCLLTLNITLLKCIATILQISTELLEIKIVPPLKFYKNTNAQLRMQNCKKIYSSSALGGLQRNCCYTNATNYLLSLLYTTKYTSK